MRIHSDSYDPQGHIARWLVKLDIFDFEMKHIMGKQHGNTDGMSRHLLLRCTQYEIHHQGAYETKRGKKVDVVTTESSAQTDILSKKKRSKSTDKVKTLLPAQTEGEEKEKSKLTQNNPVEPKRDLEYQTSKARVMTRGQRPQGSKKGAPPSWLDGKVCLGKDGLSEEYFVLMLCAGSDKDVGQNKTKSSSWI